MNKEHILKVAESMIDEQGLINLTRRNLSDRAGIADGSFNSIMGCTFSEFIAGRADENDDTIHEISRRRADPTMRKKQIINVALDLSKVDGYHKIGREDIATAAGVSPALVSKYFGTLNQLRRSIIRAAIKQEIPEIIAQGIANRDDHVKNITDELKQKALRILTEY